MRGLASYAYWILKRTASSRGRKQGGHEVLKSEQLPLGTNLGSLYLIPAAWILVRAPFLTSDRLLSKRKPNTEAVAVF